LGAAHVPFDGRALFQPSTTKPIPVVSSDSLAGHYLMRQERVENRHEEPREYDGSAGAKCLQLMVATPGRIAGLLSRAKRHN